jgi:hypothetical protein
MEKKSTSGLAVASLVLGILAAISSFVPIVNNASFFIALVGVVLAVAGIMTLKKNEKSGKGIAIAGLVLGIVSIVIVLATQSFYGAVLDEASDSLTSSTQSTETTTSTDNNAEGVTSSSDNTSTSTGEDESESTTETTKRYGVTIDSCEFSTDYEGNKAAVVTYTFTNNSDDATSFAVAVTYQAFQNGVQLETAVNTAKWDSENAWKEIKPGASIQVQQGYKLDDASDITIEVEDWLTWSSDKLIATATYQVQ